MSSDSIINPPDDSLELPPEQWAELAREAEAEGDLGKAQMYWRRAYCAARGISIEESDYGYE